MKVIFLHTLLVLGTVSLAACGSELDDWEKPRSRGTGHDGQKNANEINLTPQQNTLPVPKLLFHGGGGGAPAWVVDMEPAKQQMIKVGFLKEHIFKITYPAGRDLSVMERQIAPQIESILESYPDETMIDLIGHSLGQPVALIMASRLGILPRVKRMIGLAGVLFGQRQLPFLCRNKWLAPFLCGDIFDALVGEGKPKLILNMLERHQKEIERIQFCSLYSPEDGMLDPFDAGAFSEGLNISIPQVNHLRFKSDPRVFQAMFEKCYKNQK